jgi:hypothetical protein
LPILTFGNPRVQAAHLFRPTAVFSEVAPSQLSPRVNRQSGAETSGDPEFFGDDVDRNLWRRGNDDNVVPLRHVPPETPKDEVSAFVFEVVQNEFPRASRHVAEVAAGQHTLKESLLGPVGPAT